MIEDMLVRNFSPNTQRSYVHYVAGLARHCKTSPEHLGLEHVRAYQVYLAEQRQPLAGQHQHFRFPPRRLSALITQAARTVSRSRPFPDWPVFGHKSFQTIERLFAITWINRPSIPPEPRGQLMIG